MAGVEQEVRGIDLRSTYDLLHREWITLSKRLAKISLEWKLHRAEIVHVLESTSSATGAFSFFFARHFANWSAASWAGEDGEWRQMSRSLLKGRQKEHDSLVLRVLRSSGEGRRRALIEFFGPPSVIDPECLVLVETNLEALAAKIRGQETTFDADGPASDRMCHPERIREMLQDATDHLGGTEQFLDIVQDDSEARQKMFRDCEGYQDDTTLENLAVDFKGVDVPTSTRVEALLSQRPLCQLKRQRQDCKRFDEIKGLQRRLAKLEAQGALGNDIWQELTAAAVVQLKNPGASVGFPVKLFYSCRKYVSVHNSEDAELASESQQSVFQNTKDLLETMRSVNKDIHEARRYALLTFFTHAGTIWSSSMSHIQEMNLLALAKVSTIPWSTTESDLEDEEEMQNARMMIKEMEDMARQTLEAVNNNIAALNTSQQLVHFRISDSVFEEILEKVAGPAYTPPDQQLADDNNSDVAQCHWHPMLAAPTLHALSPSPFDLQLCQRTECTRQLEANEECSICRGPFGDELGSLMCDHYFCRECIEGWLESSSESGEKLRCPICREEVYCRPEALYAARIRMLALQSEISIIRAEAASFEQIAGDFDQFMAGRDDVDG